MTRRKLLAATGGLALGAAGCAAPSFGAEGRTRLRYWHLFGGGDGANMTALVDAFAKEHPGIDLEATQLQWGTPYYTKLSMAGAGGRAPEVAVLHLARLAGFGPGRLLDPFDLDRLRELGVGSSQFPEAIWKRGTVDGKQYAIPFDTHPMVLYYNTDVCEKAGLLGDGGKLRTIGSAREFTDALRAAKKATGAPGLTAETTGPDCVTPWRLFATFYSQLGGTVLSADGRRLALDDAKALEILEFMASLTEDGLMVRRVDYPGSIGVFNAGKTAFHLNGEWEVSTFATSKLPFSMTRVPGLFGRPAAQADCHSFVLPHQDGRSDAATEAVHTFVAWMLKHSVDWAKGGHVPAYLPTLEEPAYLKLEPQSEYRSVIDDVVLDQPAWFAGSASPMWIQLGAVFSGVLTGSRTPRGALSAAKKRLRKLLDTPDPLGSDSLGSAGGAA
ncbi:extracellular solute-binding protein [Streptomyces sporangiiformans]|uniref:Extracellular solute-binding protein n=1 Tax=Streptomyces sporangiiformans TaxID=2315329 RepID=A0A505D414_9ACTN|nr:extracellular solute-binding protein [Streptomyces sporangiiformans]TPQ15528.1 extracellular solute-binding protein [Streptomyces sporangiiformans]